MIYFHFVFKMFECKVNSDSQNIFLTNAFNVLEMEVISYNAVLKRQMIIKEIILEFYLFCFFL